MVRYQPPTDWNQWVDWIAAGLHGRSRWRLSLILMGMVFASGRRTVTSWLRAAGIHDDSVEAAASTCNRSRANLRRMASRRSLLRTVPLGQQRSSHLRCQRDVGEGVTPRGPSEFPGENAIANRASHRQTILQEIPECNTR